MNAVIDIPLWRLALAYIIFGAAFFLGWWKRLHLKKDIIISVFRMSLQLILIGLILSYLFKIQLWYVTTLIFLIMIFFATQTIIKRSGISFRGVYPRLCSAIVLGGGSVLTYFIFLVVHHQPWYDPRYFIPIAGMVIGNSMNGSALAIERFYDDVQKRKREIETWVSFGATADEAVRDAFRKAYRSSLIPVLTNMTGMGIVFLPGMMTGQILGGSPPIIAIKYQMAIMAAILGSIALTVYFILTFEYRHMFNKYHLFNEEILIQSPYGEMHIQS